MRYSYPGENQSFRIGRYHPRQRKMEDNPGLLLLYNNERHVKCREIRGGNDGQVCEEPENCQRVRLART